MRNGKEGTNELCSMTPRWKQYSDHSRAERHQRYMNLTKTNPILTTTPHGKKPSSPFPNRGGSQLCNAQPRVHML